MPEPEAPASDASVVFDPNQRAVDRDTVGLAAPRTPAAEAARLDLPGVPTADPGWLLVEDGFSPAREREVESLVAVANGNTGTRGSLAEGSRYSSPATYLAGIFDVGPEPGAIPQLAVAPDWTRLRISVDGHPLRLELGETLEHRRVLDLRQGILWRDWRHRDPAGRVTRLRFLRLASLADRHVLLQSVTLTPENYSGRLHIEAVIEPPPEAGHSAVIRPMRRTAQGSAPPVVVELRTTTGHTAALAASSRLAASGSQQVQRTVERGAARAVESWDSEAEIGRTYRLDRLVSVHTSRDGEQPLATAVRHVEELVSSGADAVVAAHVRAWEARWQAADVQVDGDEQACRALRFASYHLSSAANPNDEWASVGARALTGDAYKGHVFWDTEIYMLPFYTFTDPPAARSLLMYRYHTLPAARAKAARLGYRGALYAWESTDSGEETTPPVVLAPDGEVVRVLTGEQEHHISADVAYAAWHYWQASGDDEFFVQAGAEIVLETARFWASRGRLEADGRYHIRRVIGPDEYHDGVDDNAYTNGMAQWNLERGAEAVRILAERWPERWQALARRLELSVDEPAEWLKLAGVMTTGFDPATGLFEQFQGYFDLEEIDLTAYGPRTVPMDVLLGRERAQRSKVIKQADVVLLLYLLWEQYPPAVRAANFRYYEPRTGHGSSLSPAIHALVAARLGDLALAERYVQQSVTIDLANNRGNAAGGVHAAALGGLWQATIFGMAGVQPRADRLELDPHLLPQWHGLGFRIEWRGRQLDVRLSQEPAVVEVAVAGNASVPIALGGGVEATLAPGRRYYARRVGEHWDAWQEAPG